LSVLSAAQKKTTRKSTPATASKKTAARKTATRKATAKKSTSKKTAARARTSKTRQSWRTGQMAPTPERYREIQQALIDKGYYEGEPSGAWGSDCATALKKFQQDQNLQADGKLDSLTLISLGLGPRREQPGSAADTKSPSDGEAKQP
jgi:peptidoglycan hydrolase-like protein with peptidoglycan-binding domain